MVIGLAALAGAAVLVTDAGVTGLDAERSAQRAFAVVAAELGAAIAVAAAVVAGRGALGVQRLTAAIDALTAAALGVVAAGLTVDDAGVVRALPALAAQRTAVGRALAALSALAAGPDR